MFGDLVGSTALSARLDPEDMRQVILAYQDACSEAVARYDGFVAGFLGDGILAYFGFPRAHKDYAERAVHAGAGDRRGRRWTSEASAPASRRPRRDRDRPRRRSRRSQPRRAAAGPRRSGRRRGRLNARSARGWFRLRDLTKGRRIVSEERRGKRLPLGPILRN
jgi:hypothetical protein